MHQARRVITEKKIYISDPSHVPPGSNVQTGPHGGHFYDTDGGDGEAPKDDKQGDPKELYPKQPGEGRDKDGWKKDAPYEDIDDYSKPDNSGANKKAKNDDLSSRDLHPKFNANDKGARMYYLDTYGEFPDFDWTDNNKHLVNLEIDKGISMLNEEKPFDLVIEELYYNNNRLSDPEWEEVQMKLKRIYSADTFEGIY